MPTMFISGAGRRMGRSLALHFARAGWNMALHFHRSEQAAEELNAEINRLFAVRTALVQADIRSRDEIRKAITETVQSLGPLDVLVNNAGVYPERTKVEAIEPDFWQDVLNTNLSGHLWAVQEFVKRCTKPARIINMVSLGGFEVWRERTAYNVSKAALIHLTKSLARELAPAIAVNGIAPGLIVFDNEPAAEEIKISPARMPMQRYGTPEDICEAAAFFATAPLFITGQILGVDGGYALARGGG